MTAEVAQAQAPVAPGADYAAKFALLDQAMRWEVADLLREANLSSVNQGQESVRPAAGPYVRYGKRALDLVVSSAALLVALPVNALLAPFMLADLGRPLVFTQERTGRDGQLFKMIKLRTMRHGTDRNGRPLLGEQRVTKLGRVIRRTSLDELLNFWNVFKGDMSLIGPRPLVPEYYERFSDRHRQRYAVRPGLECPTPEPLGRPATHDDQFENDCWYVENVSLANDIKLIGRVVATALDPKSNASRGSSSRGSFMGYDEDGHVITDKTIPAWALDRVLERHGLLKAALPVEEVTTE